MKKILGLIIAIILILTALAGCSGNTETPAAMLPETPAAPDAVEIRIGGLKGPTSIGMVSLMESAEKGVASNNYIFTVAGSADEITPKLIQGGLDLAAIPANLASVLYNNTKGEIRLLAINTLGVNYIVEKGDSIKTFEDLRGKTIYATGKGSTPEYILRYLLKEKGIDPDKDVTIEWKSEPAEVVALLSQNSSGIAMMPQPYVVVAQSKVAGLRIAIDMSSEWDNLKNGSMLITGVLVARRDFIEKYPQQIALFLEEYKASTEYANTNIAETALLVEKYGIVSAAVAEKAIPYCNITYIIGDEMKTAMEGYLNVLFEQNPKSIGGALPENEFYYFK